jgi:cobalt-zinc-cadmium efflux system outer membrane protein
MSRATLVVPATLIFVLAACASPGQLDEPEPRSLGRDLPAYRADAVPREVSPEPAAPAPDGVVTLRSALAAALLGSPDLASASWEARAADARALQASLYPNPELEFEVEDWGGSGDHSGFSAAEITFRLSQEIPLAGKLGRRTDVADIEGRMADWEYEAARLDVLTETTKAFLALLAAQERAALAEEAVRLDEDVARVLAEQVAAGKASPVAEKEAIVAVQLRRLQRDRQNREVETARHRLAAHWGAPAATFDSVEGDLTAVRPVPPAAALEAHLFDNPDLARWDDALALSRSKLESERAEAWPDLTVTGGVKRVRELDLYSFLVGVTIPLPLFDRNQGGVRAASADARRTEESRRAAEMKVRTEFRAAWGALKTAAREAETLTDSVLPTAREAFEATREGFRRGKFSYLELLVAQRTLFETREQLIVSLVTYHQAVADVERLLGLSLSQIDG